MKEISDFSTSVMWRNLKSPYMWRNFRFLHICYVQEFKISPHDRFFSTGTARCAHDKYQVCVHQTALWLHTFLHNFFQQHILPKCLLISYDNIDRGKLCAITKLLNSFILFSCCSISFQNFTNNFDQHQFLTITLTREKFLFYNFLKLSPSLPLALRRCTSAKIRPWNDQHEKGSFVPFVISIMMINYGK